MCDLTGSSVQKVCVRALASLHQCGCFRTCPCADLQRSYFVRCCLAFRLDLGFSFIDDVVHASKFLFRSRGTRLPLHQPRTMDAVCDLVGRWNRVARLLILAGL